MNTLIYKRTHRGDPDDRKVFGIHDCMGPVRGWNFKAVIGVGGKRPWAGHEGIALKINWVGVNPDTKKFPPTKRGPRVSFERFILYDEKGPMLKKEAPNLFKYMFEDQHVRVVMSRSLSNKMQDEIQKILRLAKKCRTRPLQSGKILSKTKCCVRKSEKPDC
jgi:hypothetical protein